MTSQSGPPPYDPMKEVETLQAIAEELHRLADEATERYRAALARIEPTPPLLDAMKDRR